MTITGAFFGTVAALARIASFTVVHNDSVLPHQGIGICPVVGAGSVAVTLRTSLRRSRWWGWPHEDDRRKQLGRLLRRA